MNKKLKPKKIKRNKKKTVTYLDIADRSDGMWLPCGKEGMKMFNEICSRK